MICANISVFLSFLGTYICIFQKLAVPLQSISMKGKLLIILLFACSMCAQAREDIERNSVYQGFSGGMMLHTGYLFGLDSNAPKTADGRLCSPQGALFGVGGALRVHLWKHLRTGFEGFVSTMPSSTTDCKDVLQKGSYVRLGCGGVLADFCWRLDKAWPFIGGVIGGGSMKGLYITPYVGCDYCLTRKVHITFRLDWMLAIHHSELCMPTGPRLYFGFMFCH